MLYATARFIDRKLGLAIIAVGVIAGSLLIAMGVERGPGLGAYLPWASALMQGSPDPITDTITLSPTGFPLLQWYPGAALFISLPKLMTAGVLDLQQSARVAAWIAILATLVMCASLFYKIGGNRSSLVLLGLSLLLVATNTGYYIRLLGAEVFAMALVASLVWLAWVPRRIGNVELAGLAALAGLLMTARPQAILMSSPALALGLLRWAENQPRRKVMQGMMTSGVLLSLALFIVLQVNYWMTGEWTRPAYYFGNEEFRSVDFSAPYLRLVLFDKAGVRSTPFLVVGFCALVAQSLNRGLERRFRAFYLLSLAAGLAQIWIVAGYYGWAGGAWVFGSRYLNLLSIYSVIPVVHILASTEVVRVAKGVLLMAAFGCAAYTFSLLNFPYLIGWFALGGMPVVWLVASRSRLAPSASDLTYAFQGISFVVPVLYYYAAAAREQAAAVLPIPAVGLACVTVVIALFLTWRAIPRAWVVKGIAGAAMLSLMIGFSLIVRLRAGAADFQDRELASPSPGFLYINRFDIRNLQDDLRGWTVYKWPDHIHSAMITFLEQEKRRTAIQRSW
jgi:hypothetical protein